MQRNIETDATRMVQKNRASHNLFSKPSLEFELTDKSAKSNRKN